MRITVIAGNGIGGTEKAAFIYAAELAKRGHQVTVLTQPVGPRSATLQEAGVRMEEIPYETESLLTHLYSFKPDIVHQHVSGYGDQRPLYDALDRCAEPRPRLIETNVFGRLMDRYDRGHVAFRMFVSLASGCQAFQRPSILRTAPDPARHSVLTNPLTAYVPPTSEMRTSLRKQLGLMPDDFLFVRLGQPGGKWRSWDCEAFQIARKRNPRLKLLLMEPSPKLNEELQRGRWGDGILIHKASKDFNFISNLYGSADGMIHASDYGESFGYTLAEAMQAGLPIITRSTPWGDNAQVQLVGNGNNGFVCCSIRGMSDAILKISENPELCRVMSEAARTRISGICDLRTDTDLLEEIMSFVCVGSSGPRMREKFTQWMAYRDEIFEAAQADVHDPQCKRPWQIYCTYRKLRSSIRHMTGRFR